jgi:L-lysine exporter family protein LysE/ArgO
MWFGLLGFGAAAAAPKLQNANTWRVIDALVALLMTGLGLQLLLQPL